MQLVDHLLNWFYLHRKPRIAINLPKRGSAQLVICSVAFNNTHTISWQIKLFKKKLVDDYVLVIIDNSTDEKTAKQIKTMCEQQQTAYLRPPKQPSNVHTSYSHGLVLNWVYRQFCIPLSARACGFVDHDIFPYKNTSILQYLEESNVYGLKQTKKRRLYYWPGFFFFNQSFVKAYELSFLPAEGFDTGFSNWGWLSIVNLEDPGSLAFAHQSYSCIDRLLSASVSDWSTVFGNGMNETEKQSAASQDTLVEKIDDWLHFFNASDWKKTGNKDAIVEKLVKKVYRYDKQV